MKLTEFDKGIFVKIDPTQLELLKCRSGFLSKENYPDHWKVIAVENEVGRFLDFRLIKEDI